MPGRGLAQTDTVVRLAASNFVGPEPDGKVAPRDRDRKPQLGKKSSEKWCWNESDERALANGCRFDEWRGRHFCQVCEQHLILWEGDFSGQPFKLMPYQREVFMRLFGWVRWNERLKKWVRRFRKCSLWVPKKNGKSPAGAAVGLYLLKWDGEPGAKVYSAAKDGKQAQIVHKHAQNMVLMMDPVLKKHFGINRGTKAINYPKAFGEYTVLSGDNIAGQEGLNGSVIIDEVHVVDERLAQVLQDMGASRAEPLQFEISTAGNDPTGYGRKQYEYGRMVEAGDVIDEAFFFKSYEAPQDLDDNEYTQEEHWKTANPAWGIIIDPEEFSGTLERAKRSSYDWSNFKQRRLNVWQRTAAPFISPNAWQKCKATFSLEDLEGCGGGAGLDLARVSDSTACVFIAELDGKPHQLPLFWLPEETAMKLEHLVPYDDWAGLGHITLLPGEVVQFDLIEDQIAEWIDYIGTTHLVFDPHFATDFCQRLADRTGVELKPMKQTFPEYAAPTNNYERLIIEGKLIHPDNKVLNWQIGHTIVKTAAGKKKPLKDEKQAWKSVDGVQAGIMALRAWEMHDGTNEVSGDVLWV